MTSHLEIYEGVFEIVTLQNAFYTKALQSNM